jgi:hypothetical protein
MRTLADLIEAAEGLQYLVADARADCAAARRRLEALRRSECVDHALRRRRPAPARGAQAVRVRRDHAQLLAGLVQLRARLHTTGARR